MIGNYKYADPLLVRQMYGFGRVIGEWNDKRNSSGTICVAAIDVTS